MMTSYAHVSLLVNDPQWRGNILLPRFSTINTAVAQSPDDTLILIAPGTYITTGPLNINKKLGLLGYGGRPVIQNGERYFNENNLLGGAQVVAENVTFRSPTTLPWITAINCDGGASLLAHRTRFNVAHRDGYALALNGAFAPAALRFQHCTLERGYSTIINNNLNAVSLSRCYTPNYSTYLTTGALHLDDKVLTPTDGYGHDSGEPYLDISLSLVKIESRVVDLRVNAAPCVTLFDWTDPSIYAFADVAPNGRWTAWTSHGTKYGIYYVSSDNRCPPIIHGPYTAE